MSIKQRYIIMLDVLGFKNLVNSTPLDEIINMYLNLIKESEPVRFNTSIRTNYFRLYCL